MKQFWLLKWGTSQETKPSSKESAQWPERILGNNKRTHLLKCTRNEKIPYLDSGILIANKGQKMNHDPFHSNLELMDVKVRLYLLENMKIIRVK
jgi:hypothetical protein